VTAGPGGGGGTSFSGFGCSIDGGAAAATSFSRSPDGRTCVGLSAVISAGGLRPSTIAGGGGSGLGCACGGGGGGSGAFSFSIVTSIGSSFGRMLGACAASHHSANPATACSTSASPIASGDMRPEVAEGTLATWSMQGG